VQEVLQEKLIAEGLLTQAGFQEAQAHQKKHSCAVEDSLIALRLVPEREVLRVLARQYRLQYLTTEKVQQIRIDAELLEHVPVRLAETCGVIPFRFDVDDVLWLITRGPLSADDREKIRVRAEARQVNPLLARPAVVAALIRRHYYSDHSALEAVARGELPSLEKAPAAKPAGAKADPEDAQDIITLSKELKCPACGAPASLDDFQCGKCLLLLNPEAGGSDPRMEISVVRALLSVTESRPFLKIPDPPPRDISNDATRVVAAPFDKRLVPRLVAGLDLALKPMHQFEAYVASYIDGEHTIDELSARAKLPRAEVHALLHSFKARGIIQLDSPRPAQPPPAAPAAPPAPPAAAPAPPATPVPTPFPAARPALATTPPPPLPVHVPPGGIRERHTPTGSPPASPRPPPPRTPARGAPPASAPVATPFPPAQAEGAGIRVLSRTEAQKVHDSAPKEPYTGPATPAPRRTEADNVLAQAVNMERRGDLDGAIYLLKKGISQLPQPGPLYNKLALILIHQRRDFRQAEELLHKACELEPENEIYEKNLYKVVTLAALKAQS